MSESLADEPSPRHRLVRETKKRMARADLTKHEIGVDLSDVRAVVGFAVQRAISLVGWSIKEAAGHIGREPAQVSRWIAGSERAQFDALFAVEQLRMPLIQALAELAGEPVEVTTHISMKRRA